MTYLSDEYIVLDGNVKGTNPPPPQKKNVILLFLRYKVLTLLRSFNPQWLCLRVEVPLLLNIATGLIIFDNLGQ